MSLWFELRTTSQRLVLRSDSPHGVTKRNKKHHRDWWCFLLVTRGRIELPFQPWEGRVLAAWPTGRHTIARILYYKTRKKSIPFLKVFQIFLFCLKSPFFTDISFYIILTEICEIWQNTDKKQVLKQFLDYLLKKLKKNSGRRAISLRRPLKR